MFVSAFNFGELHDADPMYPLEYCIHFMLMDKVELLLEYGAPVVLYSRRDPILNRTPIASASYMAVLYQYPHVFRVIVAEARRRNCLAAAMTATFRGCAETSSLHYSLEQAISTDFAEVLEIFLDAGLDPELGAPVRGPADEAYDRTPLGAAGDYREEHVRPLNSQCIARRPYWLDHVRSLFLSGERRREPLVRSATRRGAVKCLRLLHARSAPAAWARCIGPGATLADFRYSPLMIAFIAPHNGAVAEFFLDFHAPTADGAAAVSAAAGLDLAPRAHEAAAAAQHASSLDVDALLAERGRWGERTRVEVVAMLAAFTHNTVTTAFAVNAHRALPVLARHSRDRAHVARLREELWYAPTAEAADAALEVLVGDARARARAPAASGAAAAAAAAAAEKEEEEDLAALRRQIVTETSPWLPAAQAARGGRLPPSLLMFPALPALLAHRPPLEYDSLLRTLVFTGYPGHIYTPVPVLRALLEYTQATAAAAGKPKRLQSDLAAHSWSVLAAFLTAGAVHLAQLYSEFGADVFAKSPDTHESLLSVVYRALPPAAVPHWRSLPAEGAARLQCVTDGVFPSADAARAHAAAAAAEECRHLSAVLADPEHQCESRRPWCLPYGTDLDAAVGLRWVTGAMHARDPARARAYVLRPSAGPLARAVSNGNARCVRLLSALGARLDASAGPALVDACLNGEYELAWALLGALPDSGAVRARLLRPRVGDRPPAIDAVVIAAKFNGHRFSPALAEGIVGAGGGSVMGAMLPALCGPVMPIERAGEAARALVFVCRNLSCQPPTPQAAAGTDAKRSKCVIQ